MSFGTAQDILITGLPRSGTTLTCHLLNKLPNSVALHEPLSPDTLKGLDEAGLVETIQQFFSAQRD